MIMSLDTKFYTLLYKMKFISQEEPQFEPILGDRGKGRGS